MFREILKAADETLEINEENNKEYNKRDVLERDDVEDEDGNEDDTLPDLDEITSTTSKEREGDVRREQDDKDETKWKVKKLKKSGNGLKWVVIKYEYICETCNQRYANFSGVPAKKHREMCPLKISLQKGISFPEREDLINQGILMGCEK